MTVTGQAQLASPRRFLTSSWTVPPCGASNGDQKRVVRIVAPLATASRSSGQWQRGPGAADSVGGGPLHRRRRPIWSPAGRGHRAHRAGHGSGGLSSLRRDGDALGEDFLAIVLAELSYTAPVTVVVEDLEMLDSPVVLDELGLLAERAADGVGFVFVSREDRLPKTLRLRLRDEVAEIRQDNWLSPGRRRARPSDGSRARHCTRRRSRPSTRGPRAGPRGSSWRR